MTRGKSRATRGSISPRGGRALRKPDDRRTLEQRATFQRERRTGRSELVQVVPIDKSSHSIADERLGSCGLDRACSPIPQRSWRYQMAVSSNW